MQQTSLLKHNRRLKQRDSLPLNAAIGELGDRKSPSVAQGQSSAGGLGDEVPQKLNGVRWGGGVPSPLGVWERSGEGAVPPSQNFFLNFYLKIYFYLKIVLVHSGWHFM